MRSVFNNFGLAVAELLDYTNAIKKTCYIRVSGPDHYRQYAYTPDVIDPDHESVVAVQVYSVGNVTNKKKGCIEERNVGKFFVKSCHYESAKRVRSSAIVW